MTPQELMDLPFAGMAEKELRKCGEWDLEAVEMLNRINLEWCNKRANDIIDRAIKKLEANK